MLRQQKASVRNITMIAITILAEIMREVDLDLQTARTKNIINRPIEKRGQDPKIDIKIAPITNRNVTRKATQNMKKGVKKIITIKIRVIVGITMNIKMKEKVKNTHVDPDPDDIILLYLRRVFLTLLSLYSETLYKCFT